MTLLNKELLKKQSSPLTKKYIQEWDCDVYFKKFSIQDSILLEKWNNKKNITEIEKVLHVILLACVDEKGDKLLKFEDKAELMEAEVEVLYRLAEIANQESGLNDQNVDDKAKNS